MNEDLKEVRRIEMCEIELELDDALVEKIKVVALEMIKDDTDALVNYFVNKALRDLVDCNSTPGDEAEGE